MQIIRTGRGKVSVMPLLTVKRARGRSKCDRRSGFPEKERVAISRLATLMANGINVPIGQIFPDGWESCDGGRMRTYAICSADYKAEAHRLLATHR